MNHDIHSTPIIGLMKHIIIPMMKGSSIPNKALINFSIILPPKPQLTS